MMKDWHVKPYWKRRHRLMHALRQHHFEAIKDNSTTMHFTEMQKKLNVIDNLSKRIP
jgi:hypothetical protein